MLTLLSNVWLVVGVLITSYFRATGYRSSKTVPDVSYPKRVRVRYLGLGFGLVLEFGVRASVRVKVKARVADSQGTKRIGTKRSWYAVSGIPSETKYTSHTCVLFFEAYDVGVNDE